MRSTEKNQRTTLSSVKLDKNGHPEDFFLDDGHTRPVAWVREGIRDQVDVFNNSISLNDARRLSKWLLGVVAHFDATINE